MVSKISGEVSASNGQKNVVNSRQKAVSPQRERRREMGGRHQAKKTGCEPAWQHVLDGL